MKTLIVPKGWHMAINQLPQIVNTDSFSADIVFDTSCAYSTGVEQKDWLKCPVGFSIGLLPKGLTKPMHANSVRFGWRWNPETAKIEVAPYWYVNKVRHYAETDGLEIANLDINKFYTFSIVCMGTYYLFRIWEANNSCAVGMWSIAILQTEKLGWSANLFFGGNAVAPHKVTMKYKKI